MKGTWFPNPFIWRFPRLCRGVWQEGGECLLIRGRLICRHYLYACMSVDLCLYFDNSSILHPATVWGLCFASWWHLANWQLVPNGRLFALASSGCVPRDVTEAREATDAREARADRGSFEASTVMGVLSLIKSWHLQCEGFISTCASEPKLAKDAREVEFALPIGRSLHNKHCRFLGTLQSQWTVQYLIYLDISPSAAYISTGHEIHMDLAIFKMVRVPSERGCWPRRSLKNWHFNEILQSWKKPMKYSEHMIYIYI